MKVVIWGFKLVNGNSHTHSYVHAAFFHAYQFLGYQVNWFTDYDDTSSFDFSDTLFVTMGTENRKMPIRKDCWYVLHHVDFKRYIDVPDRILNLKAYSVHNLKTLSDPRKISRFEFLQENFEEEGLVSKCLLMPWASHLLPHEIELLPPSVIASRRSNQVYWVGSVTTGEMGNNREIGLLNDACNKVGVPLVEARVTEGWESRTAVEISWAAPCITGGWQSNVEYLPCRAFKNASFCRVPATNSQAVKELLDGIPPYHPTDFSSIMIESRNLEEKTDASAHLVNLIKKSHTYLNRIKLIHDVLGLEVNT